MEQNYNALISLLKGHRIFIQTHNYPDPDALASAFGLQMLLKTFDITSTIVYDGNIEKGSTKRMLEVFGIQPVHIVDIPDMKETDYIVTVDSQKYNSNMSDFIGKEVACIDHHPTMIPCHYAYRDVRIVGSCATLIAEYFRDSNTTLDSNTATALLYGLKVDTDSFSRGVTDLDIEMFAYLHRYADDRIITELYSKNMEIEDLHAYGEAIRNIEVYENVGFARIGFDCPDALIAMISDFILALDVVEFSVIYANRNGGLKFSIRNENPVYHAGTLIANALRGVGSGGGHYSMAGGSIPAENIGKLEPTIEVGVRNLFLRELRKMREEKTE